MLPTIIVFRLIPNALAKKHAHLRCVETGLADRVPSDHMIYTNFFTDLYSYSLFFDYGALFIQTSKSLKQTQVMDITISSIPQYTFVKLVLIVCMHRHLRLLTHLSSIRITNDLLSFYLKIRAYFFSTYIYPISQFYDLIIPLPLLITELRTNNEPYSLLVMS